MTLISTLSSMTTKMATVDLISQHRVPSWIQTVSRPRGCRTSTNNILGPSMLCLRLHNDRSYNPRASPFSSRYPTKMYSYDHYGRALGLADVHAASPCPSVESQSDITPYGICPFFIAFAFPSGGHVRGPGSQLSAAPSNTVSFSLGRGLAGF